MAKAKVANFRDAVLSLDEQGRERLLNALDSAPSTDPFFEEAVRRAQELRSRGVTVKEICRMFAAAGVDVTEKTVRKYVDRTVVVAPPQEPSSPGGGAGQLPPGGGGVGGGGQRPPRPPRGGQTGLQTNLRAPHAAQKAPVDL